MSINSFVRKIVYGHKASSNDYVNYLRQLGVEIGKDCIFYGPNNTYVDVQYPWMISIGDHVRITHGVVILTHDFSWSVLKKMRMANTFPGGIYGASGKVKIGNNVFIGVNAIITRNVTIGDNVIIGTGSIVTKDCPSNGVYVGNPAKYIMSVEEYYQKRAKLQMEEAKELVLEYYKKYGKKPEMSVLNEYFMLFADSNVIKENVKFDNQMRLCSNYDESVVFVSQTKRPFADYEEFLTYCFDK